MCMPYHAYHAYISLICKHMISDDVTVEKDDGRKGGTIQSSGGGLEYFF